MGEAHRRRPVATALKVLLVDVLVNGDKVFPAMLEAIDRARKRISFETYVYEKGQVADQFTAALEKAAGRGVLVNVVIDSIA